MKAPFGSTWTSWAASFTRVGARCRPTRSSAGKAGAIARSTVSGRSGRRERKSSQKAAASDGVLFIFQFATTRGVRTGFIGDLRC